MAVNMLPLLLPVRARRIREISSASLHVPLSHFPLFPDESRPRTGGRQFSKRFPSALRLARRFMRIPLEKPLSCRFTHELVTVSLGVSPDT